MFVPLSLLFEVCDLRERGGAGGWGNTPVSLAVSSSVMRHKATYKELVVQRGLKVTGVKKKVKGDKSRLDLKAWPWQ